MFPALDISSSALSAHRVRMDAVSSNLANMNTTRNEAGELEPYRKRFVVFQADESIGVRGATGVKVASVDIDDSDPLWKYEPGNPDAVKEGPHAGYVAYPNISMITEVTDAMAVARAYEANLGAMEITKDLAQQTLRILV